jgi:hypothetical protein
VTVDRELFAWLLRVFEDDTERLRNRYRVSLKDVIAQREHVIATAKKTLRDKT